MSQTRLHAAIAFATLVLTQLFFVGCHRSSDLIFQVVDAVSWQPRAGASVNVDYADYPSWNWRRGRPGGLTDSDGRVQLNIELGGGHTFVAASWNECRGSMYISADNLVELVKQSKSNDRLGVAPPTVVVPVLPADVYLHTIWREDGVHVGGDGEPIDFASLVIHP